MARRYPCPHCAKEMLLEKVHEGFEVPCPGCGARFLVPAGAADDAPPPPASPSARPAADTSWVPPPRRSTGGGDDGGMILIFGILSLLVCSLLGPVAWIMGNKARREAREAGREPSTNVTVGWVLGIASTVLTLVGVVGVLFVMTFMASQF